MSNIVISAHGLGKEYRIGHVQNQRNFREILSDAVLNPFRKAGRLLKGQATGAAGLDEVFWALRDIDFEISRGEVVGIIGRNGAGKSTLLKILSRITEPSEGYAEIYGRVASLLEVGTGFHPELTGRENIFLNGSILGMRRAEILRKFDEIVAFAEVERFIDTPIKHYSSGMGVRLAFAVAAHLEPEILIVDEVLAVGDARFQRKCLDKMESVGEQGRTVLFVSHNMPAVTRMCPRLLLVQEGRLVMDGLAADVAAAYMSSDSGTPAERTWKDADAAPGNEFVSLRAVRVRTAQGVIGAGIDIRDPVTLEIEYEVLQGGRKLLPHLWFCNEEGVLAFGSFDLDPTWLGKPRPAGHYQGSAKIPGNFFAEGLVFVNCAMNCLETKSVMFDEKEVVAFQVTDTQDGDSSRGLWTGRFPGVVRPKLDWVNEFQANEELVTRRRTVGAG